MFSLEKDLSGKILIVKEEFLIAFEHMLPDNFSQYKTRKSFSLYKSEPILVIENSQHESEYIIKILTKDGEIAFLYWYIIDNQTLNDYLELFTSDS